MASSPLTAPSVALEVRPAARRVDRDGGSWEESAFSPSGGDPMFEVITAPTAGARLGVVICGSIMVELLTNYRHEVSLSRALASRGIATIRFHYRGTGHSGGEDTASTLQTMVDDARVAVRRLVDRTGIGALAFMGTRWGALVAAAVARETPEAPIALWEPVTDGARYFRDLTRARLVREVKDARFGPGASALAQELETTGRLDILGYTLHRALVKSGEGVRLEALMTGRRGPLLLVQLGGGEALRPDYTRLTEALAAGAPIKTVVTPEEPAWFFPGYRMRTAPALVERTARWLQGTQGGGDSGE